MIRVAHFTPEPELMLSFTASFLGALVAAKLNTRVRLRNYVKDLQTVRPTERCVL